MKEENSFLKDKCKVFEEKVEELLKENHNLTDNLAKINEELELYKSVFLVKNLEIKFKQKKENFLKSTTFIQKNEEKWVLKSKNKQKKEKDISSVENIPLTMNLNEKEEKNAEELFGKHVLSLYEKFGVFFGFFLKKN